MDEAGPSSSFYLSFPNFYSFYTACYIFTKSGSGVAISLFILYWNFLEMTEVIWVKICEFYLCPNNMGKNYTYHNLPELESFENDGRLGK